MRHFASSAVVSAAALLSITPARAELVQFLGYSHGSVGVTFDIAGPQPTSGSTGAGGFLTMVNGVGPVFTTYCIDLYQYIAFNQPPYADYTEVPASAHVFRNPAAAADLARLYSSGHVVDSAVTEAAFQLAVWEIAYEASGTYKLDDGDAKFGGGDADALAALALASDWVGHLAGGKSSYSVRVLESGSYQDEVFATAVPEPGSLALVIAALGAAGAASRLRRGDRVRPGDAPAGA